MGDGIMATFGAAVTTDRFAADALRAVDDIMAAVQSWKSDCAGQGKPALEIGAAVATGSVIFGAVGDATRLEYTVIGDAVNISAKLEKHTKKEGVHALCTAETYRMATSQGYQPPSDRALLENRLVEGLAEPVDIIVAGE